MNKYKKLIPIIAVVLIALGVNLEKFGINLQNFTGQQSQSNQSQSPNSSTNSQVGSQNGGQAGSNSSGSVSTNHWSDTNPKLNLWHIFEGEINRKGKPVGYHSRPGGKDPAKARVNQVKSRPNNAGVYTASISVQDGGQWKEKFSSFFPDKMNQSDVITAVLNAYKNSKNPKKQPWTGPSGLGFSIQGYTTSRGDINTAFPVFAKGE